MIADSSAPASSAATWSIPEGTPIVVRPSVGAGNWTLVGGPGVLLGLVVRAVPV